MIFVFVLLLVVNLVLIFRCVSLIGEAIAVGDNFFWGMFGLIASLAGAAISVHGMVTFS